jgi:hypothetical protein
MATTSPPRTRRSAALLVLLAAGAFVVVAGAIRPLVPWPVEYGLRAKVEHWKQHRDEYDTVFFGSSYTHRGIRPEVVDAELARRGTQQTSFNFGVQGMGFYELGHLMDEALAGEPARLRTVFVEATSWNPKNSFIADRFENRAVFWHTGKQTARVLAAIACLDDPLLDKLEAAWPHLKMAARKFSNYAQGPRIVSALRGADGALDYLKPADLEQGRGYQDPELGHDEEELTRHEAFLDNLPAYAREVSQVEPGNARRVEVPLCAAALTRAQLQDVLDRGYRVMTIVPPASSPSPELHRMVEQGVLPEVLDFHSPRRFPQLYRPDTHYDRGHFNRSGAEIFSRTLVQQLPAAPPPGAPAEAVTR